MEPLSFDKAIELLEITDISKISLTNVDSLEKRAKKRWHPDKVAHLKNLAITLEYTQNFQLIEQAADMIRSYLRGTYHAGEAFSYSGKKQSTYQEPEDIIRSNAPGMQSRLQALWPFISMNKYKYEQKEVVISDGFKLKDMLHEDFREDIAMLSVISFFYGIVFLGLLTLIASWINPIFETIVAIIWGLQALSCILGFIPLSRFWLPAPVTDVMIKFINFGLGLFNWAEQQGQQSGNGWVQLLIVLPALFAKLVKYIFLFPLYELATVFVGHKIVGIVKQKVNYFAGAADWYIQELMHKEPEEMTREELFDLSYLYSELSDVKAAV